MIYASKALIKLCDMHNGGPMIGSFWHENIFIDGTEATPADYA